MDYSLQLEMGIPCHATIPDSHIFQWLDWQVGILYSKIKEKEVGLLCIPVLTKDYTTGETQDQLTILTEQECPHALLTAYTRLSDGIKGEHKL